MRTARSCGTAISTSVSASSSASAPPSRHVAGQTERLQLLQRALCDAVGAGPLRRQQRVGAERQRRQPGALALEAADQLRRQPLRIGHRRAGAEGQQLAAAGDAADHGLHRNADRPAQRVGRLHLQIRAVEELLLDALLEHEDEHEIIRQRLSATVPQPAGPQPASKAARSHSMLSPSTATTSKRHGGGVASRDR